MSWDDNVHSIRGIEDVLRRKDHPHSTRAARLKHAEIVLAEHSRLRGEGREYDSFALAEASFKSSQETRDRAIAIAREDAVSAAEDCASRSFELVKIVRGRISAWWEK